MDDGSPQGARGPLQAAFVLKLEFSFCAFLQERFI